MSVLRLKIKGWEDGEPVERWLEKPDRWQLHSADQVTLVIDDMEVTINQKVLCSHRQQQQQPMSSMSTSSQGPLRLLCVQTGLATASRCCCSCWCPEAGVGVVPD
jgi:hypothetical protein